VVISHPFKVGEIENEVEIEEEEDQLEEVVKRARKPGSFDSSSEEQNLQEVQRKNSPTSHKVDVDSSSGNRLSLQVSCSRIFISLSSNRVFREIDVFLSSVERKVLVFSPDKRWFQYLGYCLSLLSTHPAKLLTTALSCPCPLHALD
jgi:hypothetical protein